MTRMLTAAALLTALGGAAAADDLKSGPAVGQKVPGPFHPINVTGENAGKRWCLYCEAGDGPAVAVFARSADAPHLAQLLKEVDAANAAAAAAKVEMFTYAVYLSADEGVADKLKAQAKAAGLKKVVLAVEPAEAEHLSKYAIAKDAEVTVLVYRDYKIVANHAFAKGKMTEQDVKKIAADVAKITK